MAPSQTTTTLGKLDFRARNETFGIRGRDRLSHIYVIGKTGTGKSTLLSNMVRQDIASGEGLTLIDPHGDLAEAVSKNIPPRRAADLVYLNAPNSEQPYGYNPLRFLAPDVRSLASSGLIDVFRKMWDDRAWGPRLEHILRNVLQTLLSQEGSTLQDILRIFTSRDYRRSVVATIDDPVVKRFWRDEFDKYPARLRAEAIAPIQTKVGAYLSNPLLRRILTDPDTPISFRKIMDDRKILVVNLSRGQLGDDASSLLGGLIVNTIALAAFNRAAIPASDRTNHFVYVDEFQTFTTSTVATMLSELRKFGVGMTFAHQYLHQLAPDIQHAVLGNAGTIVAFRLGPFDARVLAAEFQPKFDACDLMNLANHHIRLKLLIDGEPSQAFSARTLAPRSHIA